MKFIINNNFLFDPDENTVEKLENAAQAGSEKIEHRISEVLLILAQNHNKTVSREMLIEKIWNNYGGGDEGLTQAISVLRKVLNDESRTLIETISKKGYKLNAEVKIFAREENKLTGQEDFVYQLDVLKRRSTLLWSAIAVLAVIIIWLAFFQKKEHPTPLPDQPAPRIESKGDTANLKAPVAK